ncbi:TetR family transcriptional regulator [Mycobacterium paraffinicum]|uniref:TetR family transcriptional regulator n=1 Tax=Mycobacterium paraffinicum TaxID=53378 RepID=A0A1Q4HVQ8_9MYCO|nr:TetR family transcriptional regulator [Mycobacterium paraffinicum]
MFWKHGYDATTTRTITAAVDIEAPSLYTAFGSKRELFAQVVDRYKRTYHGYMARALTEEPTLRAGIARLLKDAADSYTRPNKPRGCLIINAAVNCTCPEVAQLLGDERAQSLKQLETVIARAIAHGELDAAADAHTLALYASVVMQGMAAQARDGATRSELRATAALAATAWPWTPARKSERRRPRN